MFCRNTSLTNFTEPVEELTIVGYSEEPEIGTLFESTGHYYVHQSCAVWSSNTQELTTEMLSPAIVQASSRRCAYCSHYGAGIPCKVTNSTFFSPFFSEKKEEKIFIRTKYFITSFFNRWHRAIVIFIYHVLQLQVASRIQRACPSFAVNIWDKFHFCVSFTWKDYVKFLCLRIFL